MLFKYKSLQTLCMQILQQGCQIIADHGIAYFHTYDCSEFAFIVENGFDAMNTGTMFFNVI